MSRIEQLIGEIEEYIDSCKFSPLSNTKIQVNKEELEELLAPTARHELTDEGLFSEDEEEEDEFISSVMSEVSEYDDPELKALAKEIAELERQEHEQRAEKTKKKSKKKQKRKH